MLAVEMASEVPDHPLVRPDLGSLGAGTQTVVYRPVHPKRFVGERLAEVRAAAQAHAYLLRGADAAMKRSFLLAGVGKAVAAPTGEDRRAADVELGDTTAAIRAAEPGASPAEVAVRPGDRNGLPDI